MAGMTGWSLAAFVLLPATAIVLRRREGSWFSPATFFAATWTAFASLSLLNPLGVQGTGIVFVLAACLAVAAGAEVARRRFGLRPQPVSLQTHGLPAALLSLACTTLGLAAVLILLGSRGHGPQ